MKAPDTHDVPGHGRPGGIDDPVPDREYGDQQQNPRPDEAPPEPVDSLCDVPDCEELARYYEVGDGHAVPDPKRRCHSHKPDAGLWRDLRKAARRLHR